MQLATVFLRDNLRKKWLRVTAPLVLTPFLARFTSLKIKNNKTMVPRETVTDDNLGKMRSVTTANSRGVQRLQLIQNKGAAAIVFSSSPRLKL